ncbi:MAG: SLC13 family permease [Saprospiraceae bacterium]|nr:SLC13 family permease [Saprospiraceae bacterium]
MTPDILITLSIIFLAMVLFIWNRFSVDTVAILVMVAFMLTGILSPAEGFAGFSNPATLTVGAMFVLSAALFKTGVLNQLGTFLIHAGKRSLTQCLLAIMLISGVLSAFINDTAVVALLMPVVIQVARDANISPSKLLIPLSFGALLGGICTLIGTSTNILVSGIMTDHGLPPIGMFEMTQAGLVFLAAGIIYMVVVGRWLLPDRKSNKPVQESFEMSQYLAEIKLLPNAKSVGFQIADSPLTKELDLEILQLIREDGALDYPMSYTELRAGDTLKVRCDITRLKALAVRQGISVKGDLGEEATGAKLFEMLVIPNSPFVGKSLADLQFRDTYRGAAVLAIRSRKSVIHDRLGRTILNEGDILLVRSDPRALGRLKESKGLLLLSEAEKPVIHPGRMAFTLAVVVLVMILAAMNIMSIVLSATAGAILLVVSGMIKPEEAYKAIEWKVLFMLAGILTMGVALYKTGAASLLSNYVTLSIGDYGPQVVLSFFFALSFLLTNVMSNNATAALLAPIAIVAAESMGVSARPFLMAVTFAASLSFMTPVGYQTNTMILVPGRYKFSDFLRVGTPLNLMMWLLATWMLPRLFPF